MKKLLCVMLVLLLVPSCLAEGLDFSSMTPEEALDVINAARNALAKAPVEGELLRYESPDGYTLIFTGLSDNRKHDTCYIEVIFINDTDIDLKAHSIDAYVNGWACRLTVASNVNAHRRASDRWFFSFDSVGISSIDEIEDIEIYLSVYKADGSYRTDALEIQTPLILTIGGE